jgi:hypothetical protein
MGLFSLFGKKKREPQLDDEDELVNVQVKRSDLESFNFVMALADAFNDSPEAEARRREAEDEERRILAELEEQQTRRKAALEDRGVRTDLVTIDKGRADLFDMAEVLCGIDLSAIGPCEREVVDWKPLTKTGKVPKCVATFNTHWSFWNKYSSAGVVSCEVSYLADGTPYAAWISDLRGSGTFYKIKTVNGKLALVAENPA